MDDSRSFMINGFQPLTERFELTVAEKFILLSIFLLTDEQHPFVSAATIVRVTGCSRSHVYETIHTLEEKALVELHLGLGARIVPGVVATNNPVQPDGQDSGGADIKKKQEDPLSSPLPSSSTPPSSIPPIIPPRKKKKRIFKKNALLDAHSSKKSKNRAFSQTPQKPQRDPKTVEMVLQYFDIFWDRYPRKVGKQRAKEKFLDLVFDEHVDLQAIFDGLENARGEFYFTEAEFIPYPFSWLRDRRWEDEY